MMEILVSSGKIALGSSSKVAERDDEFASWEGGGWHSKSPKPWGRLPNKQNIHSISITTLEI
jgi:hypothetical protein